MSNLRAHCKHLKKSYTWGRYEDILRILRPFYNIALKFLQELHYMEQFFISLNGLYSFTCQLIFFILCEWVIKGYYPDMNNHQKDKTVLLALTSILFYSVFSYFIRRLKDICLNRTRQGSTRRPSMGNYLKFICRIILEWLKALVVVICLREQGIHYNPSGTYFVLTFIYYLATEKLLVEIFSNFVEMFSIEYLENLEHLYVPLALNIYTCIAGSILQGYLMCWSRSTFVLMSSYFVVYLRCKDTYVNYWKVIEDERRIYSSFRAATQEEIDTWDDICAVCLNDLSKAKITPCKHLFHPSCLKQCLKVSFLCPLCKQSFAPGVQEVRESSVDEVD